MKKPNFNSLANSVIERAEQPTEAAPTGKLKITTFEIEPENDIKLGRVAYWEGRSGTKKAVINKALAYYFANSPEGKKNSTRLMPDEE